MGTDTLASPSPKNLSRARLRVSNMIPASQNTMLHKIRVSSIELVSTDTIVGNATQIQIPFMLAHRRNHGMIHSAQLPQSIKDIAILVDFDDAETERTSCR